MLSVSSAVLNAGIKMSGPSKDNENIGARLDARAILSIRNCDEKKFKTKLLNIDASNSTCENI